ncbi:hypothetical protein BGW36DRAFT_14533 [Talaromyces proteolyticus]|uniref:Uncharacterized protein n=1 Tax=Talaromyces proteolyticus TaxID=1131652 RepID=A0AAD4Q6N4_9EURO|nr:uncharacterized protein BGW36DRAFT_14533 [Talaromyces proteolyticus]KAH8705507.1 hypothetical protein BGW36DRAFT_14533 [Talaromyces proteolyticus]
MKAWHRQWVFSLFAPSIATVNGILSGSSTFMPFWLHSFNRFHFKGDQTLERDLPICQGYYTLGWIPRSGSKVLIKGRVIKQGVL